MKKRMQRQLFVMYLLWIAGLLIFHKPLMALAAGEGGGMSGEIEISAPVSPDLQREEEEADIAGPTGTEKVSDRENLSDSEKEQEKDPDTEEPSDSGKEPLPDSEQETEDFSVLQKMPNMRSGDSIDKSGGLEFSTASALPLTETVYTAGGGEIVWKPTVEGNRAVSGTLVLKNAAIDGRIVMPVPLRIELEGINRITENTGKIGIYISTYSGEPLDLTICGSGSLELNTSGSGIQLGGNLAIEGTTLLVNYGGQGTSSANGLYTIQGDVAIRNSRVSVKNDSGLGRSSGAIFASQSGSGGVKIENSHVIVVNDKGTAIHSPGNMEFVSSDVRVTGNTNADYATGALNFQYFRMDGGTLYGKNLGSDLEIPLFPVSANRVKAENNAAIYTAGASKVLPFQGDCIWYIGCTYEEASDGITVGDGYVYGNVTWNDNILFTPGKAIHIGLYSNKDTTLTVPAGMTAEIPAGCGVNVRSSKYQTESAFVNQGILNVQDNASIYNTYDTKAGTGGLMQNLGELNVAEGGIVQNQSRLENSGTISTAGNFSTILLTGYDGTIANTGTINGFIIEMHDDSYVNVANGRTVLKAGQTLTLGQGVASGGSRSRALKVAKGGELIIEPGAVVDAKTNITLDTLQNYIDLQGSLVVDGLLMLPENVPEEVLSELLEKVSGSGEIILGDGNPSYIITVDMGEVVEKQLIEKDGQVNLPDNPAREGYIFRGWYVRNKDNQDLEPFEIGTPVKGAMEIVSGWTAINQWTEPLTVQKWVYGSGGSKANAVSKFGTVRYCYSQQENGTFTEEVPVKAGIWYVKAIVEETEDYTGLTSKAVSFQIEPKAYEEGGDITVSPINSLEDTEKIVVKDGETILQEGTDYQINTVRNDNRVTVTITWIGNYSGTTTRSFLLSDSSQGSGTDEGDNEGGGNETKPGDSTDEGSGNETKPGDGTDEGGGNETKPGGGTDEGSGNETKPGDSTDEGSGNETKPGNGEDVGDNEGIGNETKPGNDGTSQQTHLSKSVKSGDSSPVGFWMLAFISSCILTAALVLEKIRHKARE